MSSLRTILIECKVLVCMYAISRIGDVSKRGFEVCHLNLRSAALEVTDGK